MKLPGRMLCGGYYGQGPWEKKKNEGVRIRPMSVIMHWYERIAYVERVRRINSIQCFYSVVQVLKSSHGGCSVAHSVKAPHCGAPISSTASDQIQTAPMSTVVNSVIGQYAIRKGKGGLSQFGSAWFFTIYQPPAGCLGISYMSKPHLKGFPPILLCTVSVQRNEAAGVNTCFRGDPRMPTLSWISRGVCALTKLQ